MTPLSGGADDLRPPGGEHWDDPRYEAFGLTADHVCRMWARYVDQTHPPPPHIANLIIGVTADVRAAIESDRARRQGALTAFHEFFADQCEHLYWSFGARAIDLYNAAAVSLKGAKD